MRHFVVKRVQGLQLLGSQLSRLPSRFGLVLSANGFECVTIFKQYFLLLFCTKKQLKNIIVLEIR